MVITSIKRVVSIFILRPQQNKNAAQVALFRRCETMPTFPGHWAGISGSIEDDDDGPLEAAIRELKEETNVGELFDKFNDNHDADTDEKLNVRKCMKQGLHVDVSSNRSKGAFGGRIIRVYPFALRLPVLAGDDNPSTDIETDDDNKSAKECSSLWENIEMKGTEHDEMKYMNIDDFLHMTDPCVPSLKMAFHHATSGSYLELPNEIRDWEKDRVNGAAFLARQAVTLAAAHTTHGATKSEQNNGANITDNNDKPSTALSIAMLRPSMVPIVNVMNEFDCRMQLLGEDKDKVRDELLQSLEEEVKRCVDLGVENILTHYKQWQLESSSVGSSKSLTFVIGTFSRSSTMKSILGQVLEHTTADNMRVLCSQSTPGDEGELMAFDVPNAKWMPDETFKEQIEQGNVNLVLIGADCILLPEGKGVVNKVGTTTLAACCKRSNVPIICCADRWKLWEDAYSPGLEDIFELVPHELLDSVLVPNSVDDAEQSETA